MARTRKTKFKRKGFVAFNKDAFTPYSDDDSIAKREKSSTFQKISLKVDDDSTSVNPRTRTAPLKRLTSKKVNKMEKGETSNLEHKTLKSQLKR